ncbi:NAD-dependent epimerase/dehydratase family protein [Thomasclavelia cocleata]|uniref:NAD-dependent epimerase/dehydratase family protein n=1 Tax=Thomasclavelia cocleata TaxID=69824 RepID=UPI002557D04E|nr:NAD-dependent epimerase/dehydratase family protein [Thomasclavelia cocleata]
MTKRVLITGANSYIGTSFERYIKENYPDDFKIDTLDMLNPRWKEFDFSKYDSIFHVAGIAHQKETNKNKNQYYKVNRDLTIKIAVKAKESGIKQFIFLSSMSVYGLKVGVITKDTIEHPASAYGDSKYQAEKSLINLQCETFKVAIIRPPMVYGKGCRGNYQRLRDFALKSPVFPNYMNKRSMLFIGNLTEFIKCIIDTESAGLFLPQNKEYVSTYEMVELIAKYNSKSIKKTSLFNNLIKYLPIEILKKLFGNLVYEKIDVIDKYNFSESIMISEK